METGYGTWKKRLDTFLVWNLFVIILGALFFMISAFLSSKGYVYPYIIFQKLWFPLFIPSLSLFFTAVSIEVIVNYINRSLLK